jgi:hypothetical protein
MRKLRSNSLMPRTLLTSRKYSRSGGTFRTLVSILFRSLERPGAIDGSH